MPGWWVEHPQHLLGSKMAKQPASNAQPKEGENPRRLTVPCLQLEQSGKHLYIFSLKASKLYEIISINRRDSDKDAGYQRVLSSARVEAVKRFIEAKQVIPVGIVVSLNEAKYDKLKQTLSIPPGSDVGWVIDGQHRLAGAHRAATEGHDIELPVIAFVDLDEDSQVQQFVTINREGKGVPTSLVLDLLNKLSSTNPADAARERANDLANKLRRDEDSVFWGKIAVVTAPKSGQISNTNFVRKVAPLVIDKGRLNIYTLEEQASILENYFRALKQCFGEEWSRTNSLFFQTVGFGGFMNVFDTVFAQTLSRYGGFRVSNIVQILELVADFDFSLWRMLGSGNKAEQEAANDFLADLNKALNLKDDTSQTSKIKL